INPDMKKYNFLAITFLMFILLLIFPDSVMAKGKGSLALLPLLLGIIGNAGGAVAVIGTGLHAKNNPDNSDLARIIAIIGGAWCAYAWLGWPMKTEQVFLGLGYQSYEVTEFSLIRLVGLVGFAFAGYVIFEAIAEGDSNN
ncbi:MAG: hypothetical protein AAF696_32470, partial [Bacteroidota bacterium]